MADNPDSSAQSMVPQPTPSQPPAQPNADKKATGSFSKRNVFIVIVGVITCVFVYLFSLQTSQPKRATANDKEREQAARSVAASRTRSSGTDYQSRVADLADDLRKSAEKRAATMPALDQNPGLTAGMQQEALSSGSPVPLDGRIPPGSQIPADGSGHALVPVRSGNSGSGSDAQRASSSGNHSSGPDADATLRNLDLQLEVEARKRDMKSLSAELVVYDARKIPATPAERAGRSNTTPESATAPRVTTAGPPPFAGAQVPAKQPPAAEAPAENSPTSRTATLATQRRQEAANRSEGPTHRLFEGTVIETVLTNRLDGTYTGPVNCMVSVDIWSHNREHLLIPKGTRVLGEAKRVTGLGQQRLAVTFHRLLMPDGFSVSLDQFVGMNQIGEAGLRDKVNNHYIQLFGTSVALGAIAGLSSRGANYGVNQSAGDAWRQGFSNQISTDATRILDRFMNILPTVTIREGNRVKVYLTDDLLLPAYAGHRMSSNL